MSGPLRLGDNSRKIKKTRSMSLDGENEKKPVSSLISKVSDGLSQQKKKKEETKVP